MVSNTSERWQHSIYTPEHEFKGLNHWVKIDANLISDPSCYFNTMFHIQSKMIFMKKKRIAHNNINIFIPMRIRQKILTYMYHI